MLKIDVQSDRQQTILDPVLIGEVPFFNIDYSYFLESNNTACNYFKN